MTTIVIAEDHRILRELLGRFLRETDDTEVVAEAEDGLEALRCVQDYHPDLVLLDLSMPKMDGLAVLRKIKRRNPDTRVLVLTMHDSRDYISEALQAGADGYCLKEDLGSQELSTAIESVLSGRNYLSPGISEDATQTYIETMKSQKFRARDFVTQREKEVIKLIGEGYKNKEIADFLSISVKTVEKHRSNIMRKLHVHTASALTAIAIEKGLVGQPATPMASVSTVQVKKDAVDEA
jgi:DNA-binding NarL/FixJ family response regulator